MIAVAVYLAAFAVTGAILGPIVVLGGPWSTVAQNVWLGFLVGLFTAAAWPLGLVIGVVGLGAAMLDRIRG